MRCGRWILPSQHVRLIGPAKALRQVVLVMNSCGSCPSSADQTLADIRHSPLQIGAEAGDGVSVRPVGNATQLNETQLIERCDPRRTAAPRGDAPRTRSHPQLVGTGAVNDVFVAAGNGIAVNRGVSGRCRRVYSMRPTEMPSTA
jgi:hypothetical protein